MQNGGEEGSVVMAVEDTTEPQINVMMDVAVLLCQACLLPLKPPIFKCEAAGHALCSYCRGGHGNICSRADTHCGELDGVVLVEMQMRSSTSPGAVVAMDEPTFLAVPRTYLVPGPSGAVVALSVRIDKVSPWSS